MKSETTLQLGDVVKDRITGFKGVIVARTDWLNGCVRMTVQPEGVKDSKIADSVTFDVEQLELVKAGKHAPSARSGGPCEDRKALAR
jgi:hypothetical protein